jgi:glycine reductase
MGKIAVVHYLNQFFGQIGGGEEMAGAPPQLKSGPVGPGVLLQGLLGPDFQIVTTAICGDNTFAENPEAVGHRLVELIAPYKPRLLIAGPAFNSGRYGQSCAQVCVSVQDELHIPVLTGMFEENPGAEFRSKILIVRTGPNARHMRDAMAIIAPLAARLGRGEAIERPAEVGCFACGMKRSVVREHNAAQRIVDMLLLRLAGEPFTSEVSIPVFDRVEPVRISLPLCKLTVGLITDGGLVVKGNPDRMPSGYTDRMTSVPIGGCDRLTTERVEVNHGGYDNKFVNADPERLVPLEAMRALERNGIIGKLNDTIYATAGAAMSLSNAKKVGQHMARLLHADGVQAAILTST